MERVNQCFLNALRAALKGEALQEPCWDLTQEEWGRLIELAQCHHVLPMVFEAIHDLPELKAAAFWPPIKRQIRQQVLIQTQKTSAFLELTRQLHAAGIRPLVVKGIICRTLYPHPDHRVSGDEDLLIPEGLTLSCHQALTDCGMVTAEAPERLCQVYEIPYRKENSPLYIELHRHLFPPESEAYGDLNSFFTGVFDRAVTQQIQGIPIATMGHTDHLFYLICHAFKHFLHSGFGIRQVCDIVMYANAYGSQIDWLQVLRNCGAIHADRFAAAIFQIGKKHLVFDPEKACYPQQWQRVQADETAMLEDLLCGGVYGGASMSRKHSSSITLDAVAADKKGQRKGNALLLSLFPSAKALEGRYPYLKAHPYLLPAAWISRIFRYGKESRGSRDNNAAEALKIGSQRIELLREYGIID